MNESRNSTTSCLLWRAQGRLGVIAIEHVAEVLRPLKIEALPDAPPFVIGASIIRGRATPVVDIAILLAQRRGAPARLVVVRTNEHRRVALAVDEVIGIRALASTSITDLPPLLKSTAAATVSAIAALDGELIVVLRSAWLIPDSLWSYMEGQDG